MERILKTYLKRLTNLSGNNKSLLLKRLISEQFLDLHGVDFLLDKPSFEVISQLIKQKNRIPLCDVLDPRFEKGNLISKRLRKIARTDLFITEERGTNDLYVGYPFIKGRFADGTPVHAPLLFFPVQLRMDREKWVLFPGKNGEIILNQSFALAYSQFNQVHIPDEVLEKSFDTFSTDALEFRTQLYEWLKETPFRINFNQDLFQNQLVQFSEQSPGELNTSENIGELKLYPEAVLGIFPQSGSFLVPDYVEMLRISSEPGPFHFPLFKEELSNDTTIGQAIREEHILNVFPSDTAQEQIIRAAKKGQSLVVQGPPGTGKSQLICNLMTDFASQGKKVLLVCQKRAALDVVYDRLKSIDLQNFIALIHDFRNDRPELYRQLHEQIESVDEYKNQNYSLDAVFLEREFIQNSRQADKILSELETFKVALYDESLCGMAVRQLYLTSSPHTPRIDLSDLYTSFRLDGSNTFIRRLKAFTDYQQIYSGNHTWKIRNDFSNAGINDLHEIDKFLKNWPELLKHRADEFLEITGEPFHFSYLEKYHKITGLLEKLIPLTNTAFPFLSHLLNSNATQLNTTKTLIQKALVLLQTEVYLENTLTKNELPVFKELLLKGIQAKESLGGIKWIFFPSRDKKKIQAVLNDNSITSEENDLQLLFKAVDAKIKLNDILDNSALVYFNTETAPSEHYITWCQNYLQATEAADLIREAVPQWETILEKLTLTLKNSTDLADSLKKLENWCKIWQETLQKLNRFFSDFQQRQLIESPQPMAQQLSEDLKRDFDNLVEIDRLWNGMSENEKEVFYRLSEVVDSSESQKMISLFDNSIRLAWIDHIETVYPILRAVSSQKMTQLENELQENIISNRTLSRDIALMRLREDTYKNLENNRLGNRLTYRELGHQLTKKRKIWPVRKLLNHYHEEILRLVPCWMASPESVSAIFPMEKDLFDLVIFDEASQCYSEYGLPAIYRSKQVIITGDSKQLPPGNIYQVRYEEMENDDEFDIATETTSLLDLGAQYLSTFYLTGHYRSHSLDLIDFSNRYFYNGKLRLLPNFHYLNNQEPGIQVIKTNGIWEKNINLEEADQVINLVRSLVSSGKSIGVVTFNYFQQRLIQELLEQENINHEGLFVKNIENVQGDECDIIIFSIGYARDAKGKLVMQFGTLNQSGGENRLNVAITRAREKIYIITSIWPQELNTENSAHEGPRLLRAYLEYAVNVSEGNFRPFIRESEKYQSGVLLKKKLQEENHEYEAIFPFADLAIRKNHQYSGLILTDDDLYHQSISQKEPHANLPLLLREKKWPFKRIFSRQYWMGKHHDN